MLGGDRRSHKNRLTIATFNVEWLFLNGGQCPGVFPTIFNYHRINKPSIVDYILRSTSFVCLLVSLVCFGRMI